MASDLGRDLALVRATAGFVVSFMYVLFDSLCVCVCSLMYLLICYVCVCVCVVCMYDSVVLLCLLSRALPPEWGHRKVGGSKPSVLYVCLTSLIALVYGAKDYTPDLTTIKIRWKPDLHVSARKACPHNNDNNHNTINTSYE